MVDAAGVQRRRATDALWLQLKGALVAEAQARSAGEHDIRIDDAVDMSLGLQNGGRSLAVHAAREIITCTILTSPDPDSRRDVPIGLHPGKEPPFRLNGQALAAENLAAALVAALLD